MTIAEIFETMDYGPAPESDKDALAWLARHDRAFGHHVGGRFTAVGETFDVVDPATSKVLAKVTQGTAADVDAAVRAA